MSELATIIWSSRSRLTHLIHQLVKSGWVRREAFPGDRRGAAAVLTDQGFAALERAVLVHVESVRRCVFDLLTAEQLRDISQTLLPHLAEPGASGFMDALVDRSRSSHKKGAAPNAKPSPVVC